jgi:ERCC4-related helicase
VWFLAPTVALCTQQHDYLRSYLPAVKTQLLTGADNVDRWSEQRIWNSVLEGARIVVSTHAVLADALSHGFIAMRRLALIVFDEGNRTFQFRDFQLIALAHSCVRRHPANVIMKNFYHPTKARSGEVPHILGLSASPILRSNLKELE